MCYFVALNVIIVNTIRWSVLAFCTVRNPKGHLKLYSKGADTIIFDRLDPCNEDLMYTTSEHLNVSSF